MSKLEKNFQSKLIDRLYSLFPGAYILKNDANYWQGIPDIIILWFSHWATLECKKSEAAERQPNQEDYVEDMNSKSFSAFVYPENVEEVLDALQQSFRS